MTEKPILKTVYDQLIKDRRVKNQNDFASIIEFNSVATSQMIRGLKPLNMRLLYNLYSKLNINLNFIFSGGLGDLYNSTPSGNEIEIEKLNSQLNDCSESVKKMEKVLADKEKIISLYEIIKRGKTGTRRRFMKYL